MKLLAANMNPYENIYSHRIQGPLDRIQAVKRRKEGIIFDSSYQVTWWPQIYDNSSYVSIP